MKLLIFISSLFLISGSFAKPHHIQKIDIQQTVVVKSMARVGCANLAATITNFRVSEGDSWKEATAVGDYYFDKCKSMNDEDTSVYIHN